MNKYELQQIELKQKWDLECKQYDVNAQQLNSVAMQYCNQFNSFVTIINVERHLMRKEVDTLYRFLTLFGDVGGKLTPFDYVAEDWLFTDSNPGRKANANTKKASDPLDFSAKTFIGAAASGVVGAASFGATAASSVLGASSLAGAASIAASTATVGLAMPLAIPIAIPAYMIIKGLKKNADAKEEFLSMQEKYHKDKLEWEKQLSLKKDEISFFATAVQIADMYRILIATIRDTITDKIIPELNGILAFLYADAIKNCIVNNEDPDNAHIGNIAEYRGTPYESHYTFVKNAFDFYLLISKFFTEPVLSNLIQKRKISESEFEKFRTKMNDIRDQRNSLLGSAMLGGDS